MVDNPFAELSLERAIGLRWTLRDIQARRLKMSPVSDEDLRVLTELGMVEVRDEGLVLTRVRDRRAERVAVKFRAKPTSLVLIQSEPTGP